MNRSKYNKGKKRGSRIFKRGNSTKRRDKGDYMQNPSIDKRAITFYPDRSIKKNWLTLNEHGKKCLRSYLCAISASDLLTSELDYLNKKGLTDNQLRFKDSENRHPIALECLTDLGIETTKHYFPKYI